MGIQGIDVSYVQGKINWDLVASQGIKFAIVKASQGKLLKDPSVGPFADPRFLENVKGAKKANIPIGVYHYLCAGNIAEAEKEARFFLKTIEPVRNHISLWSVIDAEEDKYLPSNKQQLTNVILHFAKRIQVSGCKPMLYTNPNYLTYKLGDVSSLPLFLAYWGVSEQSALRYKPLIWQYGIKTINNVKFDGDIGYFDLPSQIVKGDKVRVINPIVYGTNRRFATYYPTYTVLSISGARAVIGFNGIVTAAIDVKNLEKVSN